MDIWQPLGFSEIGQRVINQDYLLPNPIFANTKNTLFIACDGIGGLDKGEVASEILANVIQETFLENKPINPIDLNLAIQKSINQYNDFLKKIELGGRMGSTIALVQIHENFAVVAHIGDSRVYHFRSGQILYQSEDHKKVIELVKVGIITEEQAKTHPWRNKLTKAVVSDINSGNINNLAEIKIIDDIQPNDIFFLCTDGILEQITNELISNFVTEYEPIEIIEKIKETCKLVTKDNYSCYLIKIK